MKQAKQRFDGDWTTEKLERARKYLSAFPMIMSRQQFRFAYGVVLPVLALFFFGIFMDVSIADSQDRNGRPQLAAKLTEDKIKIGSELELTISFTFVNDGSEPITIYKKLDIGLWKGIIPEIADEQGNYFPNMVFGEPPFKGDSNEKIPVSDFVTIGPKESFVFKRSINLHSYLVKAPGRYSITLYYENPLPPKVIPAGRTVWNGPFGSIKTEPLYFVLE